MSAHETLLLLIACYKWNKYLRSFKIESIRKLGTSYYQAFVLGNFHMQQKWEGANWEVSIIKAAYCQQRHISPKYILQEMRSSTT